MVHLAGIVADLQQFSCSSGGTDVLIHGPLAALITLCAPGLEGIHKQSIFYPDGRRAQMPCGLFNCRARQVLPS